MKTYLVGGAVRDKLLGIPVKDRDWVVVGASSQKMLDAGYQQVGRDFPVFLHPDTHEEYALARTERKSGQGYTGFVVHADKTVTLEEDLLRRDLTINAIAQDDEGKLVDPFGGQQDVENRILRHVSPAFIEDPLRVLRVARFAARFHHLGFVIADETLTLMQTITASGELEALVPERIWSEIAIALREKSPQVFFQVMRDCGALAVLLPELDNLFGIPQPAKYHPEIDTGIHTLMVLEQAARLSDEPVVRFAALMHDLGKGAVPRKQWPNLKGHEQLGAGLLKLLCSRLKVPNDYRDLAILASTWHTHCHRSLGETAEHILETLEALDAWRKPERFRQFLLACEADARGRLGLEDRPYPQTDLMIRMLDATTDVKASAFFEAGFRHAEIGEQVRLKRLELIREALGTT